MEVNENTLKEISLKELSFKNWIVLAWALFWRGLITATGGFIAGSIAGGILGFIVGIICGMTNYPFDSIKLPFQILCILLGLVIGLLFIILQLKWFFRAKFRNFRIAIIKKQNDV